jgi:hypothetical protein
LGSNPITSAPNLAKLLLKNPAPHPTSKTFIFLRGWKGSTCFYLMRNYFRKMTR